MNDPSRYGDTTIPACVTNQIHGDATVFDHTYRGLPIRRWFATHKNGMRLLMSTGTRLAAIIPVFNRPRDVLDALQSVAAQTAKPLLLAVVDDGSTDETADAVENWLRQTALGFPVRLVRQPHAGVAAARNRGAAEAETAGCEGLAFLDSDDLWPEDYLERMQQALIDCPDAVAAVADRETIDYRRGRKRFMNSAMFDGCATTRIFMDAPPTPSHTVTRLPTFRAVGGFDEQLRAGEEDYHLALKLSLRGPCVHVKGRPVIKRDHIGLLSGGDMSLVQKHADHLLCRVKMMDRFVREEGGATAIPAHAWQTRLSRLWYRAGRNLGRTGQTTDAITCFERALELRPWNLRAHLAQWMTR